MADKKQVLLRLAPTLWSDINKWADDEFRSINGQIEYILSDAVKKRKGESTEGADGGIDRPEDKQNQGVDL